MEFISQYQYPLIGLGILVIMGLVGYLVDQKETGKIAESKKLRKAKLEEKKKLKEQQKAEKMNAKANGKNVNVAENIAVVSEPETVEMVIEEQHNEDDKNSDVLIMEGPTSVEEQYSNESENSDTFIIEEPVAAEDTIAIEENISSESLEAINDFTEPQVQIEERNDQTITETGEDLSVPFAFASSNEMNETVEQDALKSESSMAFNTLLEEVQAEEASMNSIDENQFLQPVNVVSPTNQNVGSVMEEDEALKAFMNPTTSNSGNDEMTTDNLDAWKL